MDKRGEGIRGEDNSRTQGYKCSDYTEINDTASSARTHTHVHVHGQPRDGPLRQRLMLCSGKQTADPQERLC